MLVNKKQPTSMAEVNNTRKDEINDFIRSMQKANKGSFISYLNLRAPTCIKCEKPKRGRKKAPPKFEPNEGFKQPEKWNKHHLPENFCQHFLEIVDREEKNWEKRICDWMDLVWNLPQYNNSARRSITLYGESMCFWLQFLEWNHYIPPTGFADMIDLRKRIDEAQNYTE